MFYVDSLQDAEWIFRDKGSYIKDRRKEDTQLEDVTIKEEITYDEVVVSQSDIMTREEATEIIRMAPKAIRSMRFKRVTLWDIAHRNGVSISIFSGQIRNRK